MKVHYRIQKLQSVPCLLTTIVQCLAIIRLCNYLKSSVVVNVFLRVALIILLSAAVFQINDIFHSHCMSFTANHLNTFILNNNIMRYSQVR